MRAPQRSPGGSRERSGAALLLVLGMCVLISVMALSFHDEMAQRLVMARMGTMDAEALARARGGLNLVKALLAKDQRQYVHFPEPGSGDSEVEDGDGDGEPGPGAGTGTGVRPAAGAAVTGFEELEQAYAMLARTADTGFEFEGGRIAVHLTDEAARINLNRAAEPQLAALFSRLKLTRKRDLDLLDDVDEEIAHELARSVVNWRSVEGLKLAGGAVDSYYEGLEPPYKARSAPFEAVEELLLVKDVTRDHLFGRPPMRPATGVVSPWEESPDAPPVADKDDEGDDGAAEARSGAGAPPKKAGSDSGDGDGDESEEEPPPGLVRLFTVFGDSRINVNSASELVLSIQPGIAESPRRDFIVESLVENRPFRSMQQLIQVLRAIDNRAAAAVTTWAKVTSNLFRVRVTAWSGKRRRVAEAVVQKLGTRFRHLMHREH